MEVLTVNASVAVIYGPQMFLVELLLRGRMLQSFMEVNDQSLMEVIHTELIRVLRFVPAMVL